MGVQPHLHPPGLGQRAEALAHRQPVADLAAEIIHQHGQHRVGEGLVEHLGGPHRAAGIADQGMRHGAQPGRVAEPVRGAVIGVADEAGRPLALRRPAADGGGIGHHLLHLRPRAVPRLHRQEGDRGQRQAHLVGVVRGHAGRADLLQEDRLQVRQQGEAAGDVDQRLAGAGPASLRVGHIDIEGGAALGGHPRQPVQHQPGGRDHRPAQEHRIGHPLVAEPLHHLAGAVEIHIGARRDVGGET